MVIEQFGALQFIRRLIKSTHDRTYHLEHLEEALVHCPVILIQMLSQLLCRLADADQLARAT